MKQPRWLIPYNSKEKNITFWDKILIWDWIDFMDAGKVYRMKYVDIGWKDVFGIFCKNVDGILYPWLYMDWDMTTDLYIDRRTFWQRVYDFFC